ncbi:hypothetical protein [Moorena sp. SIO3B2]|nr:hypothetical protein [Moorena sp. SIO3B2]NEP35849.1 hypothetical protein [Moorena sp. SIO3B2]
MFERKNLAIATFARGLLSTSRWSGLRFVLGSSKFLSSSIMVRLTLLTGSDGLELDVGVELDPGANPLVMAINRRRDDIS